MEHNIDIPTADEYSCNINKLEYKCNIITIL